MIIRVSHSRRHRSSRKLTFVAPSEGQLSEAEPKAALGVERLQRGRATPERNGYHAGVEPAPSSSSRATLLLAEELRRSVSRFVHAVRQRTDSARTAQSETLALLEREGDSNVAALAARRKVTHQTMRVIVAQLTEQGLVERRPDPADARSRLVALSPRGRRALEDDRLGRAQSIGALIEGALSDEQRRSLQAATVVLNCLSEAAEE